MFCVNSEHIALPIFFLRYGSHGAGSAQRAASRRRPLYSRALAAKIATSWFLRLIPAGFGSGRGSVRAKHGPQPASMRPAGNVSAILRPPTPAVSASVVNKITAGRTDRRPVRRKPPPGNTGYSRSAPLLAMTFLYHQNDFLRLRASVPLPASSRSTYTKP